MSFVGMSATGALFATDATGVPSLTISYTPTSRSTSTLVSCASPVAISSPTTCVATVTAQGTLTGSVTFSSDSAGSFSPSGVCVLPTSPAVASFSCPVAYVPSVGGIHTITATYGGAATHDPSSGSFAVSVTAPRATPPAPPTPTPLPGISAGVIGTSGIVSFSCGGGAMALLTTQVLSIGCSINATKGSVTLTFATPTGPVTGSFSGGQFTIYQGPTGIPQVRLAATSPPARPVRGAVAHIAARVAARAPRAHLWSRELHGRLSIRGRDSVATARGARWETIDSGSGTRTVVTHGTVSVRDRHRHQSRLVRAGHSYLDTPLPSNRLLAAPHLTPDSSGAVPVSVGVPGGGRVDVLVTAWRDNLATDPRLSGAAVARLAGLLQPTPGRFVFARAHATAQHATTLRILVTPSQLGSRLVAQHRYPVTLRLWVTYTPTGGHPRSIGYYGLHLP